MKRSSLFKCAAIAMAIATLPALGAAAQPSRMLPGDAALRTKYALPDSKFMMIDGESIHYVDEGHGLPIVLIHGSFSSLRAWDGWAKTLSKTYRVIRFDTSPEGLSGPNPTGDYSNERRIVVTDKLTRALGLKPFILVATSSGAESGTGYAAEHPDRVKALILNNIAVDGVVFDTSDYSPALLAATKADADKKGYHTPEFWRQVLLQVFYNKDRVKPAMGQEWADLNNRAPLMPSAPKPPKPAHERTYYDLPKITAPVLLLWSENDKETTLAKDGQESLSMIGSKDKTLVVVPHCGHIMPMECGDESLAAAMPFIHRIAASGH